MPTMIESRSKGIRLGLIAAAMAVAALLMAFPYGTAQAQSPIDIVYAENSSGSVAVFTAQDQENDQITWTLDTSEGNDDDFTISNGVLTFNSPPDYEAPTDNNTDNVYQVTVQASDGSTNDPTTVDVRVTVTNLDELGVVTVPQAPRQEVPLTATLTDEDGLPTEEAKRPEWQWASASSRSGPWTNLTQPSGNTSPQTYTPKAADVGKFLRVTATYEDNQGGGKTASLITSTAVKVKLYTKPAFEASDVSQPVSEGNASTTRRVAENSPRWDGGWCAGCCQLQRRFRPHLFGPWRSGQSQLRYQREHRTDHRKAERSA